MDKAAGIWYSHFAAEARSEQSKLTVPAAACGFGGRIVNHVQIMDGTAAVCADARSGTKVGHWVNPEKAGAGGRPLAGKRESEDLL